LFTGGTIAALPKKDNALLRPLSHSCELRQAVEVAVSAEKQQIVLDDERGDPEVVRGNGRPLASQLVPQTGVLVRCVFIRPQNTDAGTIEKSSERLCVLRGRGA
jgi:hypothetical protein